MGRRAAGPSHADVPGFEVRPPVCVTGAARNPPPPLATRTPTGQVERVPRRVGNVCPSDSWSSRAGGTTEASCLGPCPTALPCGPHCPRVPCHESILPALPTGAEPLPKAAQAHPRPPTTPAARTTASPHGTQVGTGKDSASVCLSWTETHLLRGWGCVTLTCVSPGPVPVDRADVLGDAVGGRGGAGTRQGP